jgi:deoxycytidylate deaminase
MQCSIDIMRIARRSPLQRYKTGAVIISRSGVYTGWAHCGLRLRATHSVHAELHALLRARHTDVRGASIWIATLRSDTERVVMSLPCASCVELLRAAGIEDVFYAVESTTGEPKFERLNWNETYKVYKRPDATRC